MKTKVSIYEVWALLLIALGTVATAGAVETETPPAKELVQYVLELKRLGVKEALIRRGAVAGGWPVGTVDRAIVYANSPAGSKAENQAAEPTNSASSRPAESATEVIPPQESSASVPKTEAAIPQIPKPTVPVEPAAPADSNGGPERNPPTTRGVPDDYLIGAGDVLHVNVWKQQEVSLPSVVVRPDGRITVPLIKDVEVGGSTPRQAEKVIAEQLAQFIVGVDVTVVVTAINSKKIYILGGVKKEGPIPYTYRMTVLQALSEAGGLTDYAKRKKIYVLRTEKGKDYRLGFNYDEVTKGVKMEQNIELLPGDQLVVPR